MNMEKCNSKLEKYSKIHRYNISSNIKKKKISKFRDNGFVNWKMIIY